MSWRSAGDESTAWIGYADFLTTLVILFFVLAATAMMHGPTPESGIIQGNVRHAQSGLPIEGCAVHMDATRSVVTGADGEFLFELEHLAAEVQLQVLVRCSRYGSYSELIAVRPGETTQLEVQLREEVSLQVEVLPGDALFAPNEFRLRPEAVERVVEVGRRFHLLPGEVVVVQGHTDDVPFPVGAGKDNWVLSGERAAAAAQVLIDPGLGVGLPECRVAIMGFGPSRPVAPVDPAAHPPQLVREHRALNRRIEFRKMSAEGLVSGGCPMED